MESRTITRSSSMSQAYIIIGGRLALLAFSLLPLIVAYRSLTSDSDRSLFQWVFWLIGLGAALTLLYIYLLRTGYSYTAVYVSIAYERFVIMMAAHVLGSVVGPFPLLLSTCIVAAGIQLRSHPLPFLILGIYIVGLYLVFSFIELGGLKAPVGVIAMGTMPTDMSATRPGDDS